MDDPFLPLDQTSPIRKPFLLKWLLLALLVIIAAVWLFLTPPGIWGKLWAIGYAVCHQMPERSFHIGNLQAPLCARCFGMHMGSVLGILFQLVQDKKSAYPPFKTILIMALFVLAFALDGINSFLHFLPADNGLYQPENLLRLITGTGMGLAISAAIVPAFHQVVWLSPRKESGLASWKQLGLLLLAAGVLVLAVQTQSPWVILPLSVITTLGVFFLLTIVYSMVWVMILRRENTYSAYRQMLVPLLGGALTALIQLGGFALARYLLTGTWAGLEF